MAAARQELEAYASQVHNASPADTALVAGARRYLHRFADGDRIYAMLLNGAEQHAAALNFNRQFAGTEATLRETYEVPGAFTKPGWDFIQDAMTKSDRGFDGEPWVTGDDARSAAGAHLVETLRNRYRTEYTQAWRRYFQNGSLVKFSGVPDAARALEQLAGDNSPVTLWLAAAAQNTSVVAPAFQTVDAAIAAGDGYRAAMAQLAAAI